MTTRTHGTGLGLGASNRVTVYLLVGMVAYLLFHGLLLPESVGEQALSDWGWVSWYTMGILIVVVGLIALQIRRASSRRARFDLWMLSFVALIYLLRESDFHRHFTTEHVTRAKFYSDPNASLLERVIGGGIMLLFTVTLITLVARYAGATARALRAGRPWAVATALWGVSLLSSQLFDQLMRRSHAGRVIEEGLEATAAGLALLAVLHTRADRASFAEDVRPRRRR